MTSCGYNNMAHVIEQNLSFLSRAKDIHSKGLIGNFDLPDEGAFDLRLKITLVHSYSKKVAFPLGNYVRIIV